MGLVQVATETVTSAVASVTLTGIDSDDVYMLTVNNAKSSSTSASHLSLRVTVGGTADSTSNYDMANKNLRADTTFTNESTTNLDNYDFANQLTTTAQSQNNSILYLYNFNNASEYSFGTNEAVDWRFNSALFGRQGGFVNTVNQSCDGVLIYSEVTSTNLTAGTFTLYRVV